MIKRYRVTVNDEIYQISVESIKGEESAPRALAPAPGPRPARQERPEQKNPPAEKEPAAPRETPAAKRDTPAEKL